IAGVSAAARLAPLGKTLVLESETSLAYHASGRSAALFEEFYGAPTVVALNQAGKSYLQTANGGVLSDRGIMIVSHPGEEEQLSKEAKAFGMDHISVAQAHSIVPILDTDKLTSAAYSSGAKDIDTDLLIQNFLREARAHNAEVRTDAKVTDIQKTPQGWRIQSGAETYTANTLINAAGAWADSIASMAGIAPLGLQPFRRSVARVPAPNGTTITHWPMLFGINESWYAKPDAGQLIISPADEDPQPPCDIWAEDITLAEGIARFSDSVTYEVTRMTAN
ncbi:MAG: NAD(P)/FAD-dependent oxidoreductase, partial [Paracoccaceae bacterium]